MDNSVNSFIVTLQENVPLSEADKALAEKILKVQKGTLAAIMIGWIFVYIVCFLLTLPPKLSVILPVSTIFSIVLILVRLAFSIGIANHRNDVREGKSVLTGKLINKHSHYKSGCYFYFVEPPKYPLTKIGVNKTDYVRYLEIKNGADKADYSQYKAIEIKTNGIEFTRYEIGAMLTVSFLPTNRVALKIVGQ